MLFEGNVDVLTQLFRKKQLLAAGDHKHKEIRPALLILSGIMRGVYGAGQVSALESFDLNDAFDTVVGISTGAPTAAYFLAKQAALGTTVYSEECTRPDFFSLYRFFLGSGGSIMNTHYLMSVFNGLVSDKKLNQKEIMRSRSNFFVGATCANTAEGKFLDAKKCQDMIEAIHASLSIPLISRGRVSINEETWTDGGISMLFPIQKLFEEYQPTGILVLANRSNTWRPASNFSPEGLILPLLFAGFPKSLRHMLKSRHTQFSSGVELIREQKISSAILWTDTEIKKFERNPEKLQAASHRAKTHFSKLLTAASIAASPPLE